MNRNRLKILALLTAMLLLFAGFAAAEAVISGEQADPAAENAAGETLPAEEKKGGNVAPAQAEPPKPAPQAVQPAANVYTITFLDAMDEPLLILALQEGFAISEPDLVPKLAGHVFVGWYDVNAEMNEIELFVFEGRIVSDVTLKAVFAAAPADVAPETGNGPTDVNPPLAGEDEGTPADARVEGPEGLDILLIDDLAIEENPAPEPTDGFSVANCNIIITSSHSQQIADGDIIYLWAELIGFEGVDITLQWQYSTGDGIWIDAEGANGTEHSFIATQASVNYGWRLAALFP